MKRITLQDKQAHHQWDLFRENLIRATPIDLSETHSDKLKRMASLEKDVEAWFKYYFPNFCFAEPAPFHKAATQRIINKIKWYEVRAWSRELAKSTRTMMEVLYLALTGKIKNIILVSSTADAAEELLMPYMIILEENQRIINDYGKQQSYGRWSAQKFITRKGVSFRSIGAGQSPRGKKNNEARPDVLLIDDIDTDEECKNPERIKDKWEWIEQALIPTVSVSGDWRIIFCGNIIAKDCCIVRAMKKAHHSDKINIRDKNGKSSWPQKNSEEDIDTLLNVISYNSKEKEYYNNPIVKGDIIKEITYKRLPKINTCDAVVVYSDPSTSNKDVSNASNKCVAIIGRKGTSYFLYKIWLDTSTTARYIEWLYASLFYLIQNGVDSRRIYIENNSLQDPFYTQVFLPKIFELSKKYRIVLPIKPDTRKKDNKFTRIEATLEPLNRLGTLLFNIEEKEDPHMERMEAQMISVSPKSTTMDGPDALEGGVYILQNEYLENGNSHMHLVKRKHNKKRM